jgi:hypothetical protein
MRISRFWLLAAGGLLAIPAAGSAQNVEFTPRADEPEERRLAEFLEHDVYAIIDGDTVLLAGQAVSGNVLVLNATMRSSTTIPGSVYVVDGDLFLRPGARVEGDVVVLGGGFYASSLAEVTGEIVYRPNDQYSVVPGDDGWTIFPVQEMPKAVELPGLYGFGFPYYQRVDALTLRWGATLRATGWSWQPSLEGEIRWLTEDGDFQGTLKQYWYPTGSFQFGFEGERVTRTRSRSSSWVTTSGITTGRIGLRLSCAGMKPRPGGRRCPSSGKTRRARRLGSSSSCSATMGLSRIQRSTKAKQ